jgi:lactoylglutathione lyase
MTKYLHTMIRISSLEDSIAFFEVLGLHEIRRRVDEKGRYTNLFLAAPGDQNSTTADVLRVHFTSRPKGR